MLALGPDQSPELRRRFAQLARLAVQHPGAVDRLMQDIEAHSEADARWRENRKLGKMIEDIVKRLKSSLLPLRVPLKTQFTGYDLGAYVDDRSNADVGLIEVKQSETLLAKIEIKATRGKAVSISNRQGKEASNDQARFWLCMVALESVQDIDEITPARVEDAARLISGIGSRLEPAQKDIQDAIETADESGFDLQHVDDIRYGIRSEVWEDEGEPLQSFVEILSRLVGTQRRL